MKLKILSAVAIAAVVIQFIPYGKNHVNPPVVSEPKWDSPRTKELFTNACANCHSNQTTYPWYSNIAPLSWLIEHDVQEGRAILNVSVWGIQKKNEGNEAAKEVREGEMPPLYYLPTHPEAKLSESQKQELIGGLEKTFGKEETQEDEKEKN